MKNEKKSNLPLLVGILIVVSIVVIPFLESQEAKTETTQTKILTKEDKVKAQFSGYDGSHRELTKAIKASMNDPKSYEHISTEYIELSGTIYVYTRFRGRNAFGGMVIEEVRASFNVDGELLEVME